MGNGNDRLKYNSPVAMPYIYVEPKCKACGGNDRDMPCAYPEGHKNCLRNEKGTNETVQDRSDGT